MKKLPKSKNVKADNDMIQRLITIYSQENIRITEKSIEKQGKMDQNTDLVVVFTYATG